MRAGCRARPAPSHPQLSIRGWRSWRCGTRRERLVTLHTLPPLFHPQPLFFPAKTRWGLLLRSLPVCPGEAQVGWDLCQFVDGTYAPLQRHTSFFSYFFFDAGTSSSFLRFFPLKSNSRFKSFSHLHGNTLKLPVIVSCSRWKCSWLLKVLEVSKKHENVPAVRDTKPTLSSGH